MRGYDRDVSSALAVVHSPPLWGTPDSRSFREYEDYDDYEEDGGEQGEEYEEEEEEEEEPRPSKEEVDYLEFRQKLKEGIRKEKMKEEGVSASQDRKKLPNDNYGSFFGPSKPVIAQRVILESKSLLENQHLATRVLQSQYKNQKSSSSTSTGSRPVVRDKIPRVINPVKQKVQKLKDTRDYSFLLSDDADLPSPPKQPPSRSTSAPTSEARPAKMPLPSKQASGSNGRIPQNVRDDRRPSSVNGQRPSSVNGQRQSSVNGQRQSSVNGQRQSSVNDQRPSSVNGQRPSSVNDQRQSSVNGQRQSSVNDQRPSSVNGQRQSSVNGQRQSSVNGQRQSSVNGQRPSSVNGQRPSSVNGQRPSSVNGQRLYSLNGQTSSRAGPTKVSSTTKSNSMLAADKRQLNSNNGNGPGRPAMSNGSQQKKPLAITGKTSQVAKISAPVMSKPPVAKAPTPALKHNAQQRKDVGNPNKYKIAPKQTVASIKPQMNKPPKQISSAVKPQDHKPKKKPIRPFPDDEDDDEMAINMIRQMFRYNPQKYAGRDDDDSDMEANFDEIMKEEKRSAKIARKEDEEQQRLIEEEERQEQMRRMAKKRKLNR
ncbi:LOW QUALITY PROTEIN: protein spt2 [Eucalyptus grandis]|uniref:LOW QUALITY PROTEIN: protein spt2 n=1 Tax=Eucalyptus grandis TaxID=71139 RepID=UPI00192E77C7|nr:LOW QUALITY PROTEIN: protein spt2 [Eucalyptus grandis]